jgi:hypothetical protein
MGKNLKNIAHIDDTCFWKEMTLVLQLGHLTKMMQQASMLL